MKPNGAHLHALPKKPIDISKLASFHCPQCGRDVFRKVYSYRQVPGVISPSGRPEIKELGPLAECVFCGTVSNKDQLRIAQPGERTEINSGQQKNCDEAG